MQTLDIPASVSQRLLWMIKHYRAEFGALNCPVVCRITGPLEADALQTAVDDLTARHESLRTTFAGRGARLTQHIHPPRPLPIEWVDLSEAADPRAAADTALGVELRTLVDPLVWPARATVWRLRADEHLLCLNLHHLVTDAWSTGILLRDLCALYDRATGGSASLPATGWQPGEFVAWQRQLLAGDQLRRHHQYWRKQLAGAQLPKLTAATDRDRAAADTAGGADAVDVPPQVVAALRELARREKTTLFTVLLAVFQAQLHRVTGQPDLAVASMFANRSRPELRETVGLLAGMVLLRAQVADQRSFTDLVRHTHSAVIGAFAYQDLPFQMLPSDLVDTGGGRADDVMFNVMTKLRHALTGGQASFELVVPTDIGSRFPFELALAPVGPHDLRAVLFRADDRLNAVQARDFLNGYLGLATAVSHSPEVSLAHLLHQP